MMKFKWLVVLVLFLIGVCPCLADDGAKLAGTWKLLSWDVEFLTGERETPLGKNPTGYRIFGPEGRMMILVTGEGRKIPATDQDRSNLWKTIVAYSGMYRIEGDKCVIKVDASSNPATVGTELAHSFRLDGDRLQVITAWMDAVLRPERKKVRFVSTWDRAK